MQVIGFISRNTTREVVESAQTKAKCTWLSSPGAVNPIDDDLVLVLHVTQNPDPSATAQLGGEKPEYRCFRKCIEILCENSAITNWFPEHKEWIVRHTDKIRCIVLTSGGGFNQTEVTNAQQSLYNHGISICVCGKHIQDLRAILETTTPDELIDELCGGSSIELSLQFLCALLPFGLVWEASGETASHDGLISAKNSVDLDGFNGFELLVAEQFTKSNYMDLASSADPAVVRIISQLRAPAAHSFVDQCKDYFGGDGADNQNELVLALHYLDDSSSVPEWNTRLSALRDALLEKAPGASLE